MVWSVLLFVKFSKCHHRPLVKDLGDEADYAKPRRPEDGGAFAMACETAGAAAAALGPSGPSLASEILLKMCVPCAHLATVAEGNHG
jgi:hypothetical protein